MSRSKIEEFDGSGDVNAWIDRFQNARRGQFNNGRGRSGQNNRMHKLDDVSTSTNRWNNDDYKNNIKCWNCGQKGHKEAECPNPSGTTPDKNENF